MFKPNRGRITHPVATAVSRSPMRMCGTQSAVRPPAIFGFPRVVRSDIMLFKDQRMNNESDSRVWGTHAATSIVVTEAT